MTALTNASFTSGPPERHRFAQFLLRSIAVFAVAIYLSCASPANAQQTATWTGSGDGASYSDPANWDVGQVPVNDLIDQFNVVIPAGFSVTFDVTGGNEVTAFSLATGSSLSIAGDRSLVVLGEATVDGVVNAMIAGGTFTAAGPDAEFGSGGSARLLVGAGAQIAFGATEFTNESLGSGNQFSADGAGALLDLSSLLQYEDVLNNNSARTVLASNGGIVDLSSVHTVTRIGNSQVQFRATAGGEIKLDRLTNIVSDSANNALIAVFDGSTISAPLLTTLRDTSLALSGNYQFTSGALADIDNSKISVSGGAQFGTSQITATTFTNESLGSGNQFSADGAGSLLDLSSLLQYEDVLNNNSARTVLASNDGVVDLSSVHTVTRIGNSQVQFRATAGGEIKLDRLTNIVSDSANNALIAVFDGSTISAPLLTTLRDTSLALSGNYQFTSGALADIDNSKISVSGGAQFGTSQITATTFTNESLGSGNQFSADGAGSLLDLSSLLQYEDVLNNNSARTVLASNDGVVDLSSVHTVTRIGNSQVQFRATAGGEIKLDRLTNIVSDSANNALIAVFDGSTISAPLLTTLRDTSLALSGNYQFTSGALADIDNSKISVSGGAQFGTSQITATTFTNESLGSGNQFSADGAGSLLDLSSLLQYEDVLNNNSARTVLASNGGIVDLSSVHTVTRNAAMRLQLKATDGGEIDLSSLETLTKSGNGQVAFTALNGGVIRLDLLTSTLSESNGGPGALMFEAADGGTIDAPLLTTLDGVNITLSGNHAFQPGILTAIDNAQIFLTDGAQFGSSEIAAAKFTNATFSGTGAGSSPQFSADGEGTLLDLSSLTEYEETVNGVVTRTVLARNGGVIDLSNLQTIAKSGSGQVAFTALNGGEIRLDRLTTTVGGSTGGPGALKFEAADGGSIDAPLLTTLDGVNITLSGNHAFHPGVLTAIDNVQIFLSDGAQFGSSEIAADKFANATFSGTGAGSSPQFSADGEGTLLDLSSLTEYEETVNGVVTRTVLARNGGVIDLSNVETIAKSGSGQVAFTALDGGEIKLDRLIAAVSLTQQAQFIVDGPTSSISLPGSLHLDGAMLRAVNGGVHNLAQTVTLDNNGTLDVLGTGNNAPGAINIGMTVAAPPGGVRIGRRGSLRGKGTVVGDLTNAGLIAPGFSPEIISVVGNYTQEEAGTLEIEIGGLTPGTQHDQLQVTGAATLGGRLEFPLIDGYVPQAGESITLLTAAAVNDRFDAVVGPNLAAIAPDIAAITTYNATSVELSFAAVDASNLFVSTDVASDWDAGANWSTSAPGSTNSTVLTNQIDQDQQVTVSSTTGDVQVHSLRLLGDAADEMTTVNVTGGVTLAATTSMSIGSFSELELGASDGATGDVAAHSIDVGFNATVRGNGALEADVSLNDGATLDPGFSVGQIKIEGSYAQHPGSRLMIEIEGNADGQYDLVDIAGDAQLSGSLVIDGSNGDDILPGMAIEFLRAEDVSGVFDEVAITPPADAYSKLNYADTGVTVIFPTHGDMDGNGVIETVDIQLFALGLFDPGTYLANYHISPEVSGDIDSDGDQDFDDALVFADKFPNISTAEMFAVLDDARRRLSVPEPSTLLLTLLSCYVVGLATRSSRFNSSLFDRRLTDK